MKLLRFFIFTSLLLIAPACGEDEEESADQSGSEMELVDPGPDPSKPVIPELTAEDKELAAKAPEGMVFIKGGCFAMGNDYAQSDEKPEHEVCVKSFYMDKFEIKQARWSKVMKYNPSKFVGDDLPVEQVNYFDIQKFMEKSNGACRLPTEAEWEYAGGAGIRTRYYWGNLMDGAYAWFEDNSQATTHPVGQKKPNPFGLHDMFGNVWEWTDDWFEPMYGMRKVKNPVGPAEGKHKVIRGGGLDSSAGALRITNRTWLHPKNRVYSKISSYGGIINEIFNFVGFRCAKSITESAPAPEKTPSVQASKEDQGKKVN